MSSVNGGLSWTVDPTLHRNGGYLGIACASATNCIATGAWGERDKPFSVMVTAHRGGAFTAFVPTHVIYGVVGRVAPGVLFGVRATSPTNDPRIVRVP
jgi:hypothetical protein